MPQNMLRSIEDEVVFRKEARPTGLVQVRNVLVCGFGEEMRGVNGLGDGEEMGVAVEYHCVGYVGAGIMVLVLVYMLGEHVWARYVDFLEFLIFLGLGTDDVDRFFAQGAIKLEGEEKTLRAEAGDEDGEAHEEKSGEEKFS